MSVARNRTDLPVLLVHNIDQSWDPADKDQALQETMKFESAIREVGHPVTSVPVCNADFRAHLLSYNPEQYIVFNWCEDIPGVPRSEAIAPQILEEMNFAYTGSTYEVLKLCWDKCRVKQLLDMYGVPTPLWRVYDSLEVDDWFDYPAIVKPSREHCSYGVTTEAVVMSPDELKKRIAYIFDVFRQPALVEDFIDGREFHVSLWGNGVVQMLPPAEMDFTAFDDVRDRVCTYDSKFKPDSTHYEKIGLRLPAPLSDAEYKQLELTSVLTYRTVGCRDYARLDIRLRDGVFYVLDVNPNSDVSADASTALAAEAEGYSHGRMISHIINFAAQRHPVFGQEPWDRPL